MNLFPQVIHHNEYKGRKLPYTQVVWLKVECPFNKSVGAFCKNVYAELDRLLGTDFYEKLGEKRGNIDTLAKRLIKVVAQINLGVLVIDEIQKIQKAYSGGTDNMIDFITELVNTIGIPVVMLGSYKALYLFRNSLANTRRAIANGFNENISGYMEENSWEWKEFIENLWDIQYTAKYTELTDELRKVMYDNSLGIPDIAVKLFMHIQSRAIVNGGDEKITASLIRDVASKSLRLLQPIFRRMISGDNTAYAELEDSKPDWVALNGYIKESEHRIHIHGNLSSEQSRILRQKDKYEILKNLADFVLRLGLSPTNAESIASQVYEASVGLGNLENMLVQAAQLALGTIPNVGEQEHKIEDIPKKKNARKIKPALEEDDLRYIVQDGHRMGFTTEEALDKRGIIKEIDDLLRIN